tara:strand:+ start:269 stop:742 length:474 start_codon:yes stop_codon:yes gene_type:complete
MEVEVIDNFLPERKFRDLQSIMMGEDFPWFYKNYITVEGVEDGGYQFTHMFLDPDKGRSDRYYLMEPFEKMGKMYRIKSNLRTRTLFHGRSYYHIDYSDITTAIFYINTCNGYTKFERGPKVKTVANRMVIFDSNLRHSGFSPTDEKARVVINFNYE